MIIVLLIHTLHLSKMTKWVLNQKKLKQYISVKLCGKARDNFNFYGFIVQQSKFSGHMWHLWHGLEVGYKTLNKKFHFNKLSNRRFTHTLQSRSNTRKGHIHIGKFAVQYFNSIFIKKITQINQFFIWRTKDKYRNEFKVCWFGFNIHTMDSILNNRGCSSWNHHSLLQMPYEIVPNNYNSPSSNYPMHPVGTNNWLLINCINQNIVFIVSNVHWYVNKSNLKSKHVIEAFFGNFGNT